MRLVLLAAAALVAAPALAQAADQDVRCMVAGNVFAKAEKDPVKKQLAFAVALFFGGRADARLSPAQLKASIVKQASSLTFATVAPVMTACGQTFQAKQRALQAMGRDVAAGRPNS